MEYKTYIRCHGLVDRSPLITPVSYLSPGGAGPSLLTQISFSEVGSLTIRLSKGDRPVFAPEYAVSAPVDVMAEPVS
jgi:hypothetical protein